MTEAAVSFAGNLTDQPEIRYTNSGIARGHAPGGRVGPAVAGAVVLHRDRAPRGVMRSDRDERALPPACRSRLVKLGAARPWSAGEGGSSPDNAGTGRHCQTARARQARRKGGREEPVL